MYSEKYRSKTPFQQYTTDELLLRQTQGKHLKSHEKKEVQKYAENKRKQRQK